MYGKETTARLAVGHSADRATEVFKEATELKPLMLCVRETIALKGHPQISGSFKLSSIIDLASLFYFCFFFSHQYLSNSSCF